MTAAEVRVDNEFGNSREASFHSFSVMALALPGSMALAIPAATGREKLEPRFLATLLQAKIPERICDLLGNAEVDSAALFGRLCREEDDMHKYFKRGLGVDPDAIPADGDVVVCWPDGG